MDIKLIFSLVAFFMIVASSISYVREMFQGKTKPHVYTWLVWTVTTGIAAAGLLYGGGGYPAITMSIGSGLSLIIFFFSFKYGTRDIKLSDTLSLVACLVAIFFWVGLHNPLWSVVLGALIDLVAYYPTFRKTYTAPWSESVLSWVLWVIAPSFSILALASYNVFTLVNYVPVVCINIIFLALCLMRRKVVPKPA